jgi:hypothetical protein
MKMSVRAALLFSTALLLGGCDVSSQIGIECTLVRKATPQEFEQFGSETMPILEREIAPRQDFISFGAVECEDLICVRDAAFPPATNEDGTVNGGAFAKGYCSKECVEGSNACEVKETNGVLEGLPERMGCRALLLDQDTLEALRSADEEFYRRTFGENNSPYFCAGAPPTAQAGN